MTPSIIPSTAAQLRKFRDQPALWRAVFILFAGPFNPAAWIFGRPSGENFLLVDFTAMIFIVLVPCTIIALVMEYKMTRITEFDSFFIWSATAVGLIIAVIVGPLIMAIWVTLFADSPNMFFAVLILGWLLGFIPYFAVVLGIPCALAALLVAHLCTEPVEDCL